MNPPPNVGGGRAAAGVHCTAFGKIRPAPAAMAVSEFINPDWLVDLEVDCIAA